MSVSSAFSITINPASGTAPSWWNAFVAAGDKRWTRIAYSGGTGWQGGTTIDSCVAGLSPSISGMWLVDAYTGATVDPVNYEYLLPRSGGHQSEYDAITIGLDLKRDIPGWGIKEGPVAGDGTGDTLSDGTVPPSHHQSLLVYSPKHAKVFLPGTANHKTNGSSDPLAFSYTTATSVWSQSLGTIKSSYITMRGAACWDSNRDLIWRCFPDDSSGQMITWDPDFSPPSGTVSRCNTFSNRPGNYMSMAYSPTRDCILATAGEAGGPRVFNCNGGTAWAVPTNSGPVHTATRAGIFWHDASGAFLIWGDNCFGSIYKAVPPADVINGTWQWSLISANAGNPGQASSAGGYSKFNIIQNIFQTGRDVIINVTGDAGTPNVWPETTSLYLVPAEGFL